MTTCVFLGPTLSEADARDALEAVYLPPARRGDVLQAIAEHQPQNIAIIDGYFEQAPSVWHKELLWALSNGIGVWGAASMGALRAAELSQFGMIGVGRIFEAYASGAFAPFEEPFEDDDEVAVVHGPAETGFAASEALVDVRATLATARDAGVIDATTMQAVASAAKALFYKHRTWPAILRAAQEAGAPTAAIAALDAQLDDVRTPQKRLDALDLLRAIGGAAAAPSPAPPPFRFERTSIWRSYAGESDKGETAWPSR